MPTQGSSVVILNNNQVLLELREDLRIWALPAGGLEPGESYEQAAIREVREETGYEIELERVVGDYWRPQFPGGGSQVRVFTGKIVGGNPSQHDWESLELRWFPVDALPRRMFSLAREHVRDALACPETPLQKEQRLPWLQAVLLPGFLALRRIRNRIFPPARRKRRLIVAIVIALLLAASPLFLRWGIDLRYRGRIYDLETAPPRRVAIVFGAGITADGWPMAALADRVWTAAELYKAGKVEKLLMSGDNRFVDYNEPGAMRKYALELGVPGEDIVLDYAGRRTYDTCYRADYIFGVDGAVLVTQQFHLNRALYLCNRLGIDAVGVAADQRPYAAARWWWWRELGALIQAWLDLNFLHPMPVLGEKLPIE